MNEWLKSVHGSGQREDVAAVSIKITWEAAVLLPPSYFVDLEFQWRATNTLWRVVMDLQHA